MIEPTTTLPEDWTEVPFGLYCQYAAAPQPDQVLARTAWEEFGQRLQTKEQLAALAGLVGLPAAVVGQRVADAIFRDFNITNLLSKEGKRWDVLPPEIHSFPASIQHDGRVYSLINDFSDLTAGQYEGILSLIAAAKAGAVSVGPTILALLYAPKGEDHTLAVVAATEQAFQTLPMSVAWPIFGFFLRSYLPLVMSFQQYSHARVVTENLLTNLEAALPASTASAGFLSKRLSGGARRLIRSARKTLGRS